jgi:restriction system protein
MPIPDFPSLMLPLLKHLADGQDHTNQETSEALAKVFQLTEAERHQLLPSGKKAAFTNRVDWAKSHLKQAGLIDSSQCGIYHITERGQEILRQNPPTITFQYLDQFPGHRTFRMPKKVNAQMSESMSSNEMTPQEH